MVAFPEFDFRAAPSRFREARHHENRRIFNCASSVNRVFLPLAEIGAAVHDKHVVITILDNAVPKSMHAVQFSSNLASSMLRSSSSVGAGAERGVDGADAGRVADCRPNRLRSPFFFSLMTPTI